MSTEYRCGHCGNALTEAELDGGTCPHCGAQISPFGDVVQPPAKSPLASEWPNAFLEPPVVAPPVKTKFPTRPLEDPTERLNAIRASRTTGRLAPLTPDAPPRTTPLGLMLGIGIAVALVLACTIAATGTLLNGFSGAKVPRASTTTKRVPTLTPPATYGGFGFPTQSPDVTPLPFTGTIPTAAPTSTAYGANLTPTPAPTLTGAPELSVNPTTWTGKCTAKNVPTFALTDSGGGQITWSATADPGVIFAPTTGTVASGGPPTTVTVSASPAPHATLTFTDTSTPGAQPITVQFICR